MIDVHTVEAGAGVEEGEEAQEVIVDLPLEDPFKLTTKFTLRDLDAKLQKEISDGLSRSTDISRRLT
jgi:hypothetical protein